MHRGDVCEDRSRVLAAGVGAERVGDRIRQTQRGVPESLGERLARAGHRVSLRPGPAGAVNVGLGDLDRGELQAAAGPVAAIESGRRMPLGSFTQVWITSLSCVSLLLLWLPYFGCFVEIVEESRILDVVHYVA